MGTIVKRGESWRVVIRKNGHRTLTKTFSKMTHARRWMQDTEVALERKEVVTLDTLIGDLFQRYIDEIAPSRDMSEITMSKYRQLRRWTARLRLEDLNADQLVKWRMEYCPRTSAASFNRYLSTIWMVLYDAEAFWGVNIPVKEMRNARKILKRTGIVASSIARDRRPQEGEIERIKAAAGTTLPFNDIVDFAITTGMRVGEITRLRWADLDTKKQMILVRDRKHPTRKKGNHSNVPLLFGSFDVLMRQPRTGELVFPYKTETVCAAWKRARKAAGGSTLRFHDLRHEAISRMFEKGFSIPEVSMVSGHMSWESLKVYTNLKPESLHDKV